MAYLTKADVGVRLTEPVLTNVFVDDDDVDAVSTSVRNSSTDYWSRLGTIYTLPATVAIGEKPLLVLATIVAGFLRTPELYQLHQEYVDKLDAEADALVKDVLAGRAGIEGLVRLDATTDSLTGSARLLSNTRIFTPTTFMGF